MSPECNIVIKHKTAALTVLKGTKATGTGDDPKSGQVGRRIRLKVEGDA